ncbi:acyltransferase [Acidicapsa dinghuensis]|uniref:Acyltransferase n=1 Tax=Acidicapsa dinghuensis TaxID=2218256 RepID=A0ABW1EKX6_9BACT|nr:acyltransferase family protein [Acidicapsa dinghuensis]
MNAPTSYDNQNISGANYTDEAGVLKTPSASAGVKPPRNLGLDLLRIFATYMVMQIHSGEFFYIGPGGSVINNSDSHWVGWLNSLFRCCVPLFIMISGFFLFPVDERTFYRKRFGRILSPFLIWCAIFAFYYYFRGDVSLHTAFINVLHIPVNYGTEVGHLWFVYMLMGIYLFAPVISPWVTSASRRSMELFLVLWAVSLTIPYIHLIFPAIWGECGWNHTPMLYYFSGFMGYAVMAAYIRRFHMQPSSLQNGLAVLLIAVGYSITAFGFLHRLPLNLSLESLELTWGFETINQAMVATGFFLLFKNVTQINTNSRFGRLIASVSLMTYGMYLAHIILLNAVYSLLNNRITGAEIKLPLFASLTFVSTFLLIKLLSFLPKGKWLVG